jgi:hypothetical protein
MNTRPTTTDDFRAAVTTAMQSRGLTQRQLAALVGTHQPNLCRWLDHKADIRLATMLAVTRELGIAVRLEMATFGE